LILLGKKPGSGIVLCTSVNLFGKKTGFGIGLYPPLVLFGKKPEFRIIKGLYKNINALCNKEGLIMSPY
jgi:hypothetical protein